MAVADIKVNFTADTSGLREALDRVKFSIEKAKVRRAALEAFNEEILRQRRLALQRRGPDVEIVEQGGTFYYRERTDIPRDVYIPPIPPPLPPPFEYRFRQPDGTWLNVGGMTESPTNWEYHADLVATDFLLRHEERLPPVEPGHYPIDVPSMGYRAPARMTEAQERFIESLRRLGTVANVTEEE